MRTRVFRSPYYPRQQPSPQATSFVTVTLERGIITRHFIINSFVIRELILAFLNSLKVNNTLQGPFETIFPS